MAAPHYEASAATTYTAYLHKSNEEGSATFSKLYPPSLYTMPTATSTDLATHSLPRDDGKHDSMSDHDGKAQVTVDQLAEDGARKPEWLRNISEDELAARNKKLVRKMDMVILPIVGILYILNYIDRQNLSAAKLQGIMDDLNMTTQQFATAISILFVGYLPFQIPSNLVITKVPRPGLYICSACMIWGAISAATGAVQSYEQLLAVRIILGAVEAVFFPGAIYYLSAWYKKQELGKRLAALYIAQQVGNAFGGLFAAGVFQMDGAHGIAGWRWLFIIEGCATVGFGMIFAFLMPEFPHNARMLTEEERALAVWRIESEAGAAEGSEETGTLKGFVLALKDPKLAMLIFCNMMSQCQGAVVNYFPSIVSTLGYNRTITLVLTAPPYILAGFVYYGISWFSDRRNTVYPIIMTLLPLSAVMYAVPMATTSTGARYFSMMIQPFSSVGSQILLFKTINLHLPRPVAKRAASAALVNAIGGTSNIWASYLYYAPPKYYAAFSTMIACAAMFAFTITLYRWFVHRENRRLDSGEPDQIAKVVRGGVTVEMVNLGWRYEMY